MGRGFQLTGDGISVLELSPLLYGMVARNIGGTTKLLWRKKNNALFNRRPSHPQVDVIHQLVVLIFAIIGFCLNAPPHIHTNRDAVEGINIRSWNHPRLP
jgi:hypothetical protein